MKLLKQAGLPEALTEALAATYDMVDLALVSEQQINDMAEHITMVVTNGEASVTREFMMRFPALKLIAVFGVGYDGVDITAAQQSGIAVTNTPGVLTEDVADLALGLMIATRRQIVAAHKFIEQGKWQAGSFPWTQKVSGARLGIVGMGRIGQAIAHRAAGFSMAISYYNRRPLQNDNWQYQPDLHELAKQSDILVIAIPGGEDTRGLIDKSVLEALGSQGVLINIARGSVINEQDLIEALQHGTIAGAGLDVFGHEPDVPHSLQQQPNVVITPHMASATWQTRAKMSRLVEDNIAAWVAGRPLITPVNDRVG